MGLKLVLTFLALMVITAVVCFYIESFHNDDKRDIIKAMCQALVIELFLLVISLMIEIWK